MEQRDPKFSFHSIEPFTEGRIPSWDFYLDGNCLEGDVTESHLSKFSKLRFLSLSDNSLSLKIDPNWVPPFQIIYLGLRSCKLGPSFPSWLQTQRSLVSLDISDNRLKGSVPKLFWDNLQNVEYLNMSQNNLTGAIPNNISFKLFNRPSIFLNSNNFEGKIPQFLLQIPVSMGSLVKLNVLVLRNNNLTGELASTLKNYSNLIMLDVAENMFYGPIPSWIGESMQQLIILSMRGNHFSGHLPIQLCYLKHIQLLDLSRNMLSKGIPSCVEQVFKNPELQLKIIDISSNNLSESIDLSRNHFSGKIPSSLSEIDDLGKLDLSQNSLSGRIPWGRHFETFDGSSFEGNIDLCGEQLNKSCPGDGDQTIIKLSKAEATNDDEDSCFNEALYMSMGIGYFTGFWSLVGPMLLWRSWRNAYLRFLNKLTDSICDQLY
ncbi:receptor-like protein EIX2 [Vigna angularis]|uniref:receptor-like protein EIX2 n=1 Tax=Phaseolus angularis TaxID=3914 RepID=UPI0022B4655D|nr:receptor-like protein EIX2 [Vigna angularis]